MCLGVPGRIVEVEEAGPLRMGKVDFGGVKRRVSLAYVPEAAVGDWCVVHVGFAIGKIEPAEAERALKAIEEIIGAPLVPAPPGVAAASRRAGKPAPAGQEARP